MPAPERGSYNPKAHYDPLGIGCHNPISLAHHPNTAEDVLRHGEEACGIFEGAGMVYGPPDFL